MPDEPQQHQVQVQEQDGQAAPATAGGSSSSDTNTPLRTCTTFVKTSQCHTLFALALLWCVINCDTQLLAPNLTVVAREFNMTDSERDLYLGGYIPLAFFVLGAAATLSIGYLSDRFHRRKPLLAATAFVGETAVLLTFTATNYSGLFAARVFTGISQGGCLPIIYALVSDVFEDASRGRATATVYVGSAIGTLIGQSIAGFMSTTYGWRAPFLVVGVMGYAAIAVMLLVVTEPTRGAKEKANAELQVDLHERIAMKKICETAWIPTVALLWFYGIPSCAPWGVMYSFAQDYIINNIGPTFPGGISTAQSTTIILSYGVGAVLGGIAGGLLHDWFWHHSWHRLVPLVCGVTILFAPVPLYMVFDHTPQTVSLIAITVFPAGFLSTIAPACVKPMVLNTCVPSTRGSALGVLSLTNDLG